MRTIIYGDLHGCLEEFKYLRIKVNPSVNDKEIIIGDILDRGPYSNELLKYVRENSILSILGNDEYKYFRYKKHHDNYIKTSKKNPMSLSDKKLEIFNSLTLDENQKTLSLGSDNPTAKFWSEQYDGNQGIVVYGHQPFDEVKIDKYSFGIDTRCVFGGKLTALVINNRNNPMQNYDIVDIATKSYVTINQN